jgi:hypothetical protein
MSKSLALRSFSAMAVAVLLLGHLSPVAACMLLCIGEGSETGCCPKPEESRLGESNQLPEGPDCSCCNTVDAAPSPTATSVLKASVDITEGSGLIRIVAAPTATRDLQDVPGDSTGTRLSSLRTIVLLI